MSKGGPETARPYNFIVKSYLFFSSGNNRFNKIPTIAARLIPDICITKPFPVLIENAAPA